MTKLFLTSIFFVLGTLAFGQDVNKQDSLELALASAKPDTAKVSTLISLAKNAIIQKDSALAFNYCIQAKTLADSLNYTKGVADATFHIGSVYMENSAYKEAIKSYNQSIKIHQTISCDYMIMRGLLNIGVAYYFLGNVDEAIVYMDSSLLISKELKDYYHILRTTINLGGMYSMKSDYYKALKTYDNALDITKEQNDTSNLVALYSNIGEVYSSLANYPLALKQFQKALSIIDVNKNSFDLLLLYYYIGNVHLKLNNNDKKMEYFHKALEVSKEINNKYYITFIEIALGEEYRKDGDFKQALLFYNKALEKAQLMESESQIAQIYLSISFLYLKQEEFEKSLEMANKSLDINNNLNLEHGIAECYETIGKIYSDMNNWDSALRYLNLSRNIYEKTNTTNRLYLLYKELSDVYLSRKNYKEAYIYQVKYDELKDSIYSDENIKEITSMQMKFDYEKEKEISEIEQLKQDAIIQANFKRQKFIRNTLIGGFILLLLLTIYIYRATVRRKKDNQLLRELNATKDKFFSIIAHDLRGPLSNLNRLGELLWKNQEKYDEEKKNQLLKYLVNGSKESFNLLENLLVWARASSGRIECNIQIIDAKEIITENIELQINNAALKHISITSSVAENLQVYADCNMINTIFRNLISNAIKFTPENGLIEISSRKLKNNQLRIFITDNGVGMPENVVFKLFMLDSNHSTYGTNNEEGSGLGLKLCKELVEKNNGSIGVKSEVGVGTKFWIDLPTTA